MAVRNGYPDESISECPCVQLHCGQYCGVHSDNFKKNKAVRYSSAVLMVLIILSTMFLKQHSVFDVVTGMVLAVFMYSVVYTTNWAAVTAAKPVRKPRRI